MLKELVNIVTSEVSRARGDWSGSEEEIRGLSCYAEATFSKYVPKPLHRII